MYRKLAILFIGLIITGNCKKKQENNDMAEVAGAVKYAKYRISVSKAADLKDWLATLEKAEQVIVLEEGIIKNKKGKEIVVSKVQLSDDKVGFIESIHLGNEPLVFIKNTKAYIRPSPLVNVHAEIPEGKIGFIIEQKDGWTKVFIGKIGEIWVTAQWVEDDTFSTDTDLVIDAKEYENAVLLMKDKTGEAVKILGDLMRNARTEKFKNLAQKNLAELQKN